MAETEIEPVMGRQGLTIVVLSATTHGIPHKLTILHCSKIPYSINMENQLHITIWSKCVWMM